MRSIESKSRGLEAGRGNKRECAGKLPGMFARALLLVFVLEVVIGALFAGFYALTYYNNPYLFDGMAWCASKRRGTDYGAYEFEKIKPGMNEDQVMRRAFVMIIGKREYSAGGELCRETFWDAGEDGGRKSRPVQKPENQCVADRIEWSMNMPGPYDKEYEDMVVVFRNGRVENKFVRRVRVEQGE